MPRPSASCTCSLTHSVNSDPAFHQCEVFRRLGRPIRNWQAQAHCPQVYTRVYIQPEAPFTNLLPRCPHPYWYLSVPVPVNRDHNLSFHHINGLPCFFALQFTLPSRRMRTRQDHRATAATSGNRARRRYDRRAPRARGGPRETALGGAEPGGVARGTSRSLPRLPRGTPRV